MTSTRIPSTNGVEIALHDLGGSGPHLIILHATGFHGRCYQAIAQELTDIRHVWAPDLRGHGDSRVVDCEFPWRLMVDDALAVIAHLAGDEPVDLVGHSMGGATVLASEIRRTGTLRSAWLYEPIAVPADMASNSNALAESARRRRPGFGSYQEAIARYSSRPPFDGIDPEVLADYVHHGFRPVGNGVELKCTPENEARVFEGIDTAIFAKLETITVPVEVVGSGDGGFPALLAPRVADQLPNGRFDLWNDRTHFGPFEDPVRSAAAIRANLL